MRLPFELFVALRYLRFHRGQTFISMISLISVSGVAVGAAALVVALSMSAGFMAKFRQQVRSGSAHLTVVSATTAEPFPGAEALVELIEAFDGVEAATPVLVTPALLKHEEIDTHGFGQLYGIAPDRHRRVVLGSDSAEDPFAALERPTVSGRRAIVLGSTLAGDLRAVPGDLVRVMIPSLTLSPWGASPRTRVYEVVGTYRAEQFQGGAVRAYIGLDQARSLMRMAERSSWVALRSRDLRHLAELKEQIRGALSPEWIVIDMLEQNRDIMRALKQERLMLMLSIGLILIVAALNIVSTLILMVHDKTKEIGALTALGARPARIARVFVLQGCAIGAAGTVLGLALGTVVAWVVGYYELWSLDPEVYFLDHLPLETRLVDLLFVGSVTLLTSFVATLYPAAQAARRDPVEALRYE